MATLREMLVKIYQPRQGIIEFGPGGSTQDGATDLAVLGGGPNQGETAGQGMGGGVDFPDFRYAGVEGGAAGGTGGFDLSGIDWSDPGQVEMARRWLEGQSREGGQAGEPGGAGAGGVEYGDPDTYVDPTLAELVGIFGPGVLGLVGSIGAAGMRGHNAGLLDDELQAAGFSGLSGLQMAGAFGNFNNYGAGDPRDTFGSQGIGGLAEAAYEAQTNRGIYDSLNDPAMGVSANQRARSDTRGGRGAESSSYGGGTRGREGKSAADRHSAGNRAGPDHGGDRGGRGGNGGGRGPGSPGDRGFRYGGPVDADGEYLMHAGEHVMSPEAVETFGPDTFDRMNKLAQMMSQQHYPAR